MQRFELTEEIHRPVEEIWRCLTEPYFVLQWMKDVEGIIKIGDEAIRKGTKLKSCSNFVGRRIWSNLEVTQFEENELYEVYSDERDVRCRYTYRITAPEKEETPTEDGAAPEPKASSEEDGKAEADEAVELGPVKVQLVVEYTIGGFVSFFSSVFDKLIEEHESDHLELLRLRLEPAEMPNYTPSVVHVSEIMGTTRKIDPNATLQEIADANDSSIPKDADGDEEPRAPRTFAESEAAIAQTLNQLDRDEQADAAASAGTEPADIPESPSPDEASVPEASSE